MGAWVLPGFISNYHGFCICKCKCKTQWFPEGSCMSVICRASQDIQEGETLFRKVPSPWLARIVLTDRLRFVARTRIAPIVLWISPKGFWGFRRSSKYRHPLPPLPSPPLLPTQFANNHPCDTSHWVNRTGGVNHLPIPSSVVESSWRCTIGTDCGFRHFLDLSLRVCISDLGIQLNEKYGPPRLCLHSSHTCIPQLFGRRGEIGVYFLSNTMTPAFPSVTHEGGSYVWSRS